MTEDYTAVCPIATPVQTGQPTSWRPSATVRRHPIATFIVLAFGLTGLLQVLPLPSGAYGPLENIVGATVPAFVVTALAAGRVGVLDLARRSLRWRVPLRWYLLALLALPIALLVAAAPLYGLDPLRSLAQNWPSLLTSYLPTLAFMIVLNNVAEEVGWTGFLFARLQQQHPPVHAALLTAAPFWCWHLLSFTHDTGSWLSGLALAGFLLLPLLATRFVVGWLYNASGASVLIAGLFHATHNATVNPTGFAVAVLHLPQGEILYVLGALVTLAAAGIIIATRGRLGSGPTPTSTTSGSAVASQPASSQS
jgi:CAAX protease family protein